MPIGLLLLSLTHIIIFYSKPHPFHQLITPYTSPTSLQVINLFSYQWHYIIGIMIEREEDDVERRYIKIVLVGESGVGKSNIISRYVDNKFCVGGNPTIGLEFSEKHVKVNTEDIVLQIWDTAGQQRFRALNKTFYNNSLGALVVFDLTERSSFEMLGRWVTQLRENLAESAVLLLLGNKCDIKEQKVSVTEAFQFAKREGMGFLQTSAALGTNVREAFELLTRKIMEQVMNMHMNEFSMKTVKQKPIKIEPRKPTAAPQKEKGRCCK